MAVCPDDQLTRRGKALFRQQCVLNAGLTHIIEVGYCMFFCKFTGCLAQLCRLDVFAGRVMVQDDGYFVFIEYVGESGVTKNLYGDRGRHVIAQNKIQLCLNQISRLDSGEIGVGSENLLRHRHTHGVIPPFWLWRHTVC